MQTIREHRLVRIGILLFAFIMGFCMITANTNDVYAAVKAPAQVKNVKVSGATKTSVNVKWKKAAGAKQYQVAYKTASAKKFKFVKILTDNAEDGFPFMEITHLFYATSRRKCR